MQSSLLTVAICTWNRCALLEQTLERMRQLVVPSAVTWELLVVNNNCTDQTDAVISRFSECLPIRRLFEAKPGQTYARNCAINAARGELMIWTDDDVLVDRQWLQNYLHASAEYADASFFGGQILPWFDGTPPKWLERHWREVESAYAVRDLGNTHQDFTHETLPYGANFAVRMDTQRKYLFDVGIGLRPGSTMRGDETTLLKQMLDDGLEGMWIPEAKVQHFIPKSRQTTNYLWKYAIGQGQQVQRSSRAINEKHLLGKPRWLLRATMLASSHYYYSRCFGGPADWLPPMMKYGRLYGRLSNLPQ
ncbi:glycosyltransferase [bacterium]|nr:glycosyltransferase [bacterium]